MIFFGEDRIIKQETCVGSTRGSYRSIIGDFFSGKMCIKEEAY
jgi:hypothetical protein